MNIPTVLLMAVAVIALGLTLMRLVFWHTRYQGSLRHGHAFVVLLIRVPKESGEKETKEKEVPQQIAPAEIIFSVLGGLHAQRGIKTWLYGRQDHFTFEIVAMQGTISFYVAVPAAWQQFFEEQIHAQYPTAQLEPVDDYNLFTRAGTAIGTELRFRRMYALPIRTYKTIEGGDPLNALTNALSRLSEEESGAIQYIVRSANPRWHKKASKLIEGLRKGKLLHEVTRGPSMRKAVGVMTSTLSTSNKQSSSDQHYLSQTNQKLIDLLEGKNSKAGLDVVIRIVVNAQGKASAQQRLHDIVNAYSQYRHYDQGNGFHVTGTKRSHAFMERFIYRTFHGGIFSRLFERSRPIIMSAEEMASLFHLPLPSTETPRINWLTARKLHAPVNIPTKGILLGENIYRGACVPIRMKQEDRRRHMYIVGTTGSGKSILQSNMAIQDIQNGEGVAVIDPHGTLVDLIMRNIPPERYDDVIYFDPSDTDRPMGLNMLEASDPQQADFAVQEMIAIFYKLVTDPSMIGPMFEHNMRNAMLTLMANTDHPGTLADVPRIFTDTEFQKYSLKYVTDPIVRSFWEKEMAKTTDYHKSEMLGYLISKVGRFVENAMMRNIIGQPKSGFNFREIMDTGKIFLANLSKGKVGEMNSNLLGLIIVSKLQMAALSRADTPESQIRDFFLYIDEFQNFITDSIAIILSEARKYRLNLCMAHQYIAQLVGLNNDTKVRDAVFGNVGTVAAFRVGVDDAELLAQQLAPTVTEYDVINIDRFHAYVRLLIDNTASRPFTMQTFPPKPGDPQIASQIKAAVRLKYGRPRSIVEEEILVRTKLGENRPGQPQPTEFSL